MLCLFVFCEVFWVLVGFFGWVFFLELKKFNFKHTCQRFKIQINLWNRSSRQAWPLECATGKMCKINETTVKTSKSPVSHDR